MEWMEESTKRVFGNETRTAIRGFTSAKYKPFWTWRSFLLEHWKTQGLAVAVVVLACGYGMMPSLDLVGLLVYLILKIKILDYRLSGNVSLLRKP